MTRIERRMQRPAATCSNPAAMIRIRTAGKSGDQVPGMCVCVFVCTNIRVAVFRQI